MKTDEPDLGDAERRALRGLADGPEPPAALEAATVTRLSEAGLVAARRRSVGRSRLLAAAAAVVLFSLGVAVGLRRGAPNPNAAASALPRFALFLYDTPDEKALTDAQMQTRVDEYRNWARGVRAAGREIAGEKLRPEGRVLGPPDAVSGWPLGGYFVISAPDLDAAVAVARTCPHVKHGGRIEVRAIART